MPWARITCTYSDWRRNYKRNIPGHDHAGEGQFVVDAKADAVQEMRASGQARFANVTANNVGTSGMAVKLAADPGVNFRQI
jgi:hypothetical protein